MRRTNVRGFSGFFIMNRRGSTGVEGNDVYALSSTIFNRVGRIRVAEKSIVISTVRVKHFRGAPPATVIGIVAISFINTLWRRELRVHKITSRNDRDTRWRLQISSNRIFYEDESIRNVFRDYENQHCVPETLASSPFVCRPTVHVRLSVFGSFPAI